eukprot:gene6523-10531_t
MKQQEKDEKLNQIEQAIKKKNVKKLKNFCKTTGGLYTNEIRKKVWSLLLDVSIDTNSNKNITKKHNFSDQIDKDVDRSMWKFIRNDSPEEAEFKRNQLRNIMNNVMIDNEDLYYFQGFHDICTIFLFVCGEDVALACIKKLTILHLKDSMLKPEFDPIIQKMERIFELIYQIDPELGEHIQKSQNHTSHFAFSWILTWFSHVIEDFEVICRLFDFFLSCDIWMPIYLATSIILSRRKEILSRECEFSEVYQVLTKLPPNLDIEEHIKNSIELYDEYPPNETKKYSDLLGIIIFILTLFINLLRFYYK